MIGGVEEKRAGRDRKKETAKARFLKTRNQKCWKWPSDENCKDERWTEEAVKGCKWHKDMSYESTTELNFLNLRFKLDEIEPPKHKNWSLRWEQEKQAGELIPPSMQCKVDRDSAQNNQKVVEHYSLLFVTDSIEIKV